MSDLGPGRASPINFINICDTLADSYPEGVAHGLQKDAIQNSLDARKGRKSIVHIQFEVVENAHGLFLTFQDTNTTGLTGEVIKDLSDYKNLDPDNNWARFEGFGYSKENRDALGARGQGKFIFLGASDQYKMFYDTLRNDGIYRLGGTQATNVDRPIYPDNEVWEDDTAKVQLNKWCGLNPLEEVGTRIIVCAPKEGVLEEIQNGAFERAIQETWFRAIEKDQLEVWLSAYGKNRKVELPSLYPLPDKDSSKSTVWVYGKGFDFEDQKISSSDGTFKIKNFCAAHFPEQDIPKELQGVAIVQNGMKICSLPMDIAPPDIRQQISGYIEFDTELDRELRKGKNQHPNHYELTWRRTTPMAIKAFINHQLRSFGQTKLGIGENQRDARTRNRNNAEQKAMELFMRHAHDIDLRGSKKSGAGHRTTQSKIHDTPPHKETGLIIQSQFPNDEKKPRIDFGEKLLLSLRCFNKTTNDVRGLVSSKVLQGDSRIEVLLNDEFIELKPISANGPKLIVAELNNGTPFEIKIEQPHYKTLGEYRIKTVLTDRDSGDEIHSRTVRFWVGENPPRRLPFNLKPAQWTEKHAWKPEGNIDNNPTIYYNTDHPQYKYYEEVKEDSADYIFNICLEGAIHFILTRPHDENGNANYRPLDTDEIVNSSKDESPEKVYEQISEYIAEVRWRAFCD